YHIAWRTVVDAVAALDNDKVADDNEYRSWNFQRVGPTVEAVAVPALARVDEVDRLLRAAARTEPVAIAIAQPSPEPLALGARLGVQGYDFVGGFARDHEMQVLVGPTE